MLDEDGRDDQHRLLWAQAHTLADIGALTAQWLEGRITYLPAYWGAAPDSETAELIPVLATVNRFGFVTDCSQPGVPLVQGSGQRAAVCGFCSEEMFGWLSDAAFGTNLVILAFEPGAESGGQVVVTVEDGREHTWLGRPLNTASVDDFYNCDLPADGVAALRDAWQIHMFDPQWGRNDLLWYALELAVRL